MAKLKSTSWPTINEIDDPALLQTYVFVHTDLPAGLFGSEQGNSALAYFQRVGDQARFDKLSQLRSLLTDLQEISDKFWWEVEGIGAVIGDPAKPYWTPDEAIVRLHLHETEDWRSMQFMQWLTDILVDHANSREALPRNLQCFSLSILQISSRKLWTASAPLHGDRSLDADPSAMQCRLVRFAQCRWLTPELGGALAQSSVSEFTEPEIVLPLTWAVVDHQVWTPSLQQKPGLQPDPVEPLQPQANDTGTPANAAKQAQSRLDRLKTEALARAQRIAEDAIRDERGRLLNLALSLGSAVTLENVYSLDPRAFLSLLRADSADQVRNIFNR